MKRERHIIKSVEEGSIAEEMGIEPGDELLSVNGKAILDVLDYRFQETGEDILLLVRKPDGEEWELEIEKDYADELGIEFEDPLMDDYRSCRNKCIFCFIDQLPKGMRDTLYFKDDDTRLSFLQGNYCTLTNLSEKDIDRICYYKLSPINISVHTTNPELRKKMLNNRFAGRIEEIIQKFCDAGLEMNAQIVLCKGINDGKELDRTIADLEKYIPNIQSLSVVPSGLTKFREGLPKLELFEKEDCLKVINQLELWQQHMLYAHDTRFVYPSDEFYITAGKPIPDDEYYEGFTQLENGVGMMRSLFTDTRDSMKDYLEDGGRTDIERRISIATGALAFEHIKKLADEITKEFPGVKVSVYKIRNDFFGESITVSGLLTGQDIIAQLKGKDLGEELLLPENLLRSGEETLLDDCTVSGLEKALQTKIRIVKSYGSHFFDAIIGNEDR
ncbi:MAG: DUF512 domain-containing protein [Lachnospiraceae bacterium]|nr:DUF512 domain-containing protein [Lachnospiraceae bacterium]